jgi:hypothetical protein
MLNCFRVLAYKSDVIPSPLYINFLFIELLYKSNITLAVMLFFRISTVVITCGEP